MSYRCQIKCATQLYKDIHYKGAQLVFHRVGTWKETLITELTPRNTRAPHHHIHRVLAFPPLPLISVLPTPRSTRPACLLPILSNPYHTGELFAQGGGVFPLAIFNYVCSLSSVYFHLCIYLHPEWGL